jgi:thiol-disulfide isomerase/thioredoxin
VALSNAPEVRGDFLVDSWFRSLSVAALILFLAGKVEAFEPLKPWPGQDLPPFVLDDLDGRSITFPDARGGAVLVHYFATWCIPCRRELPALAGLASRHPAPQLRVIAVDVGEPDVRVKRFFAETPVPFPVLLDRQRFVTKAWGVDVLPTTILLDPALRPRLSIEGEFDWGSEAADVAVRSLIAPINSQQNQTSIQGDTP